MSVFSDFISNSSNLKVITKYQLNKCVEIGERSFAGRSTLISVTIPENIRSIRKYAFYYSTNLTELTCLATAPPILESDVFTSSGITSSTGTIYVPLASLSAYQNSTNWSVFASRMVGV